MTPAKYGSRESRASSQTAGSAFTICREPNPILRPGSRVSTWALELGMFLGAKRFGNAEQRQKSCIIFDVERYRFQKFISDIAGQDIAAHHGDPLKATKAVRDWLSNATPDSIRVPGGTSIASRYALFRSELPTMCAKLHLRVDELTFNNYVVQVEEWLTLNARINE
jgi:hypothetical protein